MQSPPKPQSIHAVSWKLNWKPEACFLSVFPSDRRKGWPQQPQAPSPVPGGSGLSPRRESIAAEAGALPDPGGCSTAFLSPPPRQHCPPHRRPPGTPSPCRYWLLTLVACAPDPAPTRSSSGSSRAAGALLGGSRPRGAPATQTEGLVPQTPAPHPRPLSAAPHLAAPGGAAPLPAIPRLPARPCPGALAEPGAAPRRGAQAAGRLPGLRQEGFPPDLDTKAGYVESRRQPALPRGELRCSFWSLPNGKTSATSPAEQNGEHTFAFSSRQVEWQAQGTEWARPELARFPARPTGTRSFTLESSALTAPGAPHSQEIHNTQYWPLQEPEDNLQVTCWRCRGIFFSPLSSRHLL